MIIHDNAEIPVQTGELIRMIYDSVAQGSWIPGAGAAQGDPTPEPILRTVLAFCYATGIYSSQDIEAATVHDPIVRYLCANHRPQWDTIREFRRRNGAALKFALGRLFRVVLRGHMPIYAAYSLDRFIPEYDCLSAAGERLARAIKTDSYALDF